MKIIVNICAILFVIQAFGRKYLFPEIFGLWYIQWSISALLAFFVPLGFSKSIIFYFKHEEKSLKQLSYSIIFLFIFCFNLAIKSIPHYVSASWLEHVSYNILDKTKILENISTLQTEEKRKESASIIFWEYGKKVPYKLDSGEYIMFQPTINDISKFENWKKKKNEISATIVQIETSAKNAIFFQVMEVILFFMIFSINFFYETKRYKKIKND